MRRNYYWFYLAIPLVGILVLIGAGKLKELGDKPTIPMAVATSQPTPTLAIPAQAAIIKTTESKANPAWDQVRSCDISAVELKVGAGEFKPGLEQYKSGSLNFYEKWVLVVFREDKMSSVPTKDRWDNSFVGVVWATSLDNLPASDEVLVFNDNGLFATGTTDHPGIVKLTEPIFCRNPKTSQFDWSLRENLTRLGTEKYADGDQKRVFESTFFVGRKLSEEDLRSLIAMMRRDNGSLWHGVGYIGGANFVGGRFDVKDDGNKESGNLFWTWHSQGKEFPTSLRLPYHTEIFVLTLEYADGKPTERWQRFVLWKTGTGRVDMVEPDRSIR